MIRSLSILVLALLSSPLLAAVGSWNGVAFSAWNGVAQTAWNGSAISCGASVFSATNIAGTTNLSWWIADGQTASADGILTNWTDSGLSPITLTNLGATSTMPRWTNAVVNGHAFARFDGFDVSSSALYTSTQPHTVVMVVRWWSSTISGTRYYFDATDGTKRHYIRHTAPVLELNGGTTGTGITTNKWQVLEAVFNSTSSALFTNNISRGTVSGGTNVAKGFQIAPSAYIDVAEILTYKGTLGAIDSAGTFSVAANRVALHNYLTNKYGITQ